MGDLAPGRDRRPAGRDGLTAPAADDSVRECRTVELGKAVDPPPQPRGYFTHSALIW
jgi:hypothetical protein